MYIVGREGGGGGKEKGGEEERGGGKREDKLLLALKGLAFRENISLPFLTIFSKNTKKLK